MVRLSYDVNTTTERFFSSEMPVVVNARAIFPPFEEFKGRKDSRSCKNTKEIQTRYNFWGDFSKKGKKRLIAYRFSNSKFAIINLFNN